MCVNRRCSDQSDSTLGLTFTVGYGGFKTRYYRAAGWTSALEQQFSNMLE
jgi:hypothetical protein